MRTLKELLKKDDEEGWLADQPEEDLRVLADRLLELDVVSDYETDERDWDTEELLVEVRDYLTSGRTEDALLTLERMIYPRFKTRRECLIALREEAA